MLGAERDANRTKNQSTVGSTFSNNLVSLNKMSGILFEKTQMLVFSSRRLKSVKHGCLEGGDIFVWIVLAHITPHSSPATWNT